MRSLPSPRRSLTATWSRRLAALLTALTRSKKAAAQMTAAFGGGEHPLRVVPATPTHADARTVTGEAQPRNNA